MLICSAADSSVLTRGLLSKCGVSERLLSKWPIVELKELLKLSIPTVSLLVHTSKNGTVHHL